MDSKGYLEQYGWKQGEALKRGGIKKPILVKHKKDKKGIGHQPNGSADAWWERLFDGQLKGLDVSVDTNGISFKQEKIVASAIKKQDSPLYRMFVRGETLRGTTGKVVLTKSTIKEDGTCLTIDTVKTSFNDPSNKSITLESIQSDSLLDKESDKKRKKEKKCKQDMKEKSDKKGKKEKKGSKIIDKSDKEYNKEKKDKKDKKEKKGSKSPSESISGESAKDPAKGQLKDESKSKDKKKSKSEYKDSSKSNKKRKLDGEKTESSKTKKLKA